MAVHDLGVHRLAMLAGLPLAGLPRPALETVAALEKRPELAEVAGLLRAGLAYRFGADVALGAGDRLVGGGDDIALGGGA